MASWEDYLRQNVGQPVQNAANSMSAPIDAATDARMKALQQLSAQQAAPPPSAMPSQQVMPNPQAMTGAVPGMGGRDASAPLTFDAMARQQAAQKAMYAPPTPDTEINPADYKDYHSPDEQQAPSPRQFPALQKKIQKGQPITSDDIRNHLHGMTEVTPELNKQLGYSNDEDEDEDKPKGQPETPGTAEGNYE